MGVSGAGKFTLFKLLLKEMDRILVIENGKLVESGNFEELFTKQGRFHEPWEKQKF